MNTLTLENLEFDLADGNYSELANSLEYWAKMFLYNDDLHLVGGNLDEYSECLAYLLYNMSKEMRKIDEASL
jgi:hypothetical protein